MEVEYLQVTGAAAEPYLDKVAELRIQVFREFPYLYDGNPHDDYEKKYLSTYMQAPGSLIVLAKVDQQIVGASSCIPLAEEVKEIKQPYVDAGLNIAQIFYFGESVIQKPFRGLGMGSQFFKLREAHAGKVLPDLTHTSFCAVARPKDHPLRPHGYTSLHQFWQKRGYQEQPDIRIQLPWKDIDQPREDLKELVVWLRPWQN